MKTEQNENGKWRGTQNRMTGEPVEGSVLGDKIVEQRKKRRQMRHTKWKSKRKKNF